MNGGVTPKQAKHGDRMIEAMLSRYSSGERAQRAFSHSNFETNFFKLLDELGFDPTNLLEYFQHEIYQKFLGFDCPDLTQLTVPDIRAQFNWAFPIIAIDNKSPNEAIFQALKKHFGMWRWTDKNLDDWLKSNDRDCRQSPYVIRTRDSQEADEVWKNTSSRQIWERKVPGVTLYERLVMEAWYYVETGQHLDEQNITLCTGSRDVGGGVPCVRWISGARVVFVGYVGPGGADDGWRCREVVS